MIKLYNGHQIPRLGLGTFLMTNEEETHEVILNAIKVGYRHFDTAQMYYNEEVIGNALKESGLARSEFYITTKLMNHHDKDVARKLIDESLEKLQSDYIDLLLIHWPNHDDKVNLNTWEVFEEFYYSGKVKAIGVSNFSRYQLEQLIPNVSVKPMVNQVEFHPALSQIQMFEYLDKHNIKLMGYGPLMRGQMNNEPYYSVLNEIALNHNVSIGEVLIAWGLSKNAIMIPKTSTISRLATNFSSKELKLTVDELKLIDNLNTGRRLYSDPANNVYGKFIK